MQIKLKYRKEKTGGDASFYWDLINLSENCSRTFPYLLPGKVVICCRSVLLGGRGVVPTSSMSNPEITRYVAFKWPALPKSTQWPPNPMMDPRKTYQERVAG
jgi:hypothetical protein